MVDAPELMENIQGATFYRMLHCLKVFLGLPGQYCDYD